MRKLSFLVGLPGVMVGAWMLLFVWGMSTLIDPSLEGWAWWRELLGRGGLVGLILAGALIGSGFWLTTLGDRDKRPERDL